MVLENASGSPAGDSFTDSAPADDNDPYDRSSNSQSYQIDRTNFPQPMPIIGPLMGFTDQKFFDVLSAKIQSSSKAINRQLTQDETSAMAYWTAKQISVLSYGAPLGIAGATWRCYQTRDKFKFPFFQPNLKKLNTQAWPSPKLSMFKGSRAVVLWHATRLIAYGTVGNFLGLIFLTSYSMSVAAVGELSDKRLKDFVEDVKQSAGQKMGRYPKSDKVAGPAGQDESFSRPQEASIQRNETVQDSASPTGGAFFDEATEEGKNTANFNHRTVNDATAESGQRVNSDVSPGSAWEKLRRGETLSSVQRKSRSSGQTEETRQSAQGGWARRRAEASGNPSSYSQHDEDNINAKYETQNEFDAKVEKERRAEEVTQRGDQRRW